MEAPDYLYTDTDPPSRRLRSNYKDKTSQITAHINSLLTLPLTHSSTPPSQYTQSQINHRHKEEETLTHRNGFIHTMDQATP